MLLVVTSFHFQYFNKKSLLHTKVVIDMKKVLVIVYNIHEGSSLSLVNTALNLNINKDK